MRSNCLFWAACMWFRLRKPHRRRRARDCQFSARGSRWGRFPHFGVMVRRRDGAFRFISYKPVDPRHKTCPPPIFQGSVRWGDRL